MLNNTKNSFYELKSEIDAVSVVSKEILKKTTAAVTVAAVVFLHIN